VPNAARVDAPAKVNLRLRILACETTGFHQLETLFCAISLADTVEVRRGAPGVRLHATGGVEMGPPEENLAVRAVHVFHRWMGDEPAVDVLLTKRIPSAAGLGGGSSDAAAVLRALHAMHGEPFPREALLYMAAELGSDVPFFVCGSPLALAWGRGERLLALPPLPQRDVLVAHPGVSMPTADAFRRIDELRAGDYVPQGASVSLDDLADWSKVARAAENDFEHVVEEKIPLVADARRAMLDERAEMALLAGSGSSVFGIFPEDYYQRSAEAQLRELGLTTWTAHTLEREPWVQVDPQR
jgi:4-diphosphocytidyl-2-C-methyl-D-erythritol kinase